jgi:uncharacterized protein
MGASNKGKFPKDMSPIFTKFAASPDLNKVLQNYTRENRFQYFADILVLAGLVIVCAIVFGVLGIFVVAAISKVEVVQILEYLKEKTWFENINNLKLYNVFSTFGAWVVSGFLLFRIRSYKTREFWNFSRPKMPRIWLLLPFLFISAVVIAAFLLYVNQAIDIPESISKAFGSDASSELLQKMLVMNNTTELLINLLIIALIPALFEEMFFRGTLQPLMIGFTKNVHVGIGLGGLIFAAIHLNIHQIIPMFFLALVLGYLFHYTGSLLPGIIVHFCNNAFAVLVTYYSDKSDLAKMIANDSYVPGLWELLLGLVVLTGIFYYFQQQAKQTIPYE